MSLQELAPIILPKLRMYWYLYFEILGITIKERKYLNSLIKGTLSYYNKKMLLFIQTFFNTSYNLEYNSWYTYILAKKNLKSRYKSILSPIWWIRTQCWFFQTFSDTQNFVLLLSWNYECLIKESYYIKLLLFKYKLNFQSFLYTFPYHYPELRAVICQSIYHIHIWGTFSESLSSTQIRIFMEPQAAARATVELYSCTALPATV